MWASEESAGLGVSRASAPDPNLAQDTGMEHIDGAPFCLLVVGGKELRDQVGPALPLMVN